jgi:uncharacterized OB-fold protein
VAAENRPISDISYRQYLEEETLMGSKCGSCGRVYAPPRQICIHCHSSQMQWNPLSGNGTLAAFTCIAIGPPSMAALGYGRENPYCSGVVELVEGGRVDARIEGVDAGNPESILVGMPLKVRFLHEGENGVSLAFEPRDPV